MIKKHILLAFLLMSFDSIAFDKSDVIPLVKNYSKTVACRINEESFTHVKLSGEEQYLVYWEGDLGCSGGNGTVNPVFTIVEVNSFLDIGVVRPEIKQPELNLVCAESLQEKDGSIYINGVTYGENDPQYSPKKRIGYKFGFNYDSFNSIKEIDTSNDKYSLACVQRVR